jgi:hypothetical protein
MAIYYPPIFINAYLSEKVSGALSDRFSNPLRFFPVGPTDIQQLTENFPEASSDVFAVYDRMFKMRRGPFPHIKCEQLLYYFYKMAGDPEALIETTELVLDLLDSGDESAQDLNSWIANLPNGTPIRKFDPDGTLAGEVPTKVVKGKDFLLPYFHNIKVYQLEETRDIIDFATARTYAGNKLIIDYDWHRTD